MRRDISPGQWTLTPGYACLFETAQENHGKSLEFPRINPKKSRELSKNSFVFLCKKKKKKSWEFSEIPGKKHFKTLVSPNKKETAIHEYHRLSDMDVRMRKVLAIPLQLSGAVNHCFQMVYSVQFVQCCDFMDI